MRRLRGRLERLYVIYRRRVRRRELEHLSDDELLQIIADGDAALLDCLRSMADEELDKELRALGRF